ncbi:MAG: lipopolysaccharide biosynthesis protein [Anaerolineales bacterium]|nr:lipopolysaccharide biosynthesis protein [Anaerolineales bacterium]
MVTISILARFLAPEHFGVVALATLTMDYLSVVNDLGLGAALIQKRERIQESANIAFILNVVAGTILTIAIFLIAPYAALFFKEPQVTSVLQLLGLTFIITSFGSVQNVLLQKELNFRKKIIPELGSTIVKAVISISLAVTGFGVWALVFGQIIGVAFSSLLLWIIVPWRPSFSWDTTIARDMFKYGLSIMGNNAMSIWEDSFDYFVIGLLYTPAALGIYTLAYKLPQTLVLHILWIMTAVLFPAFSSLQNQIDALKKSFLLILRYVELLVTPLCLGMVIAADPLIRVAFGEQWLDAIPILRILSLYVWVVSIGFHVGDIYKAIGRPDILIKMSIPMFALRILLLWIGAQYSLVGVALAHLTASIVSDILRYFVAKHFLKLTFIEVVRELTAFVCGIGLAAFAVPALYLTAGTSPLVQLIVVVCAGAVGYIGTAWFIERSAIVTAFQTVGINLNVQRAESK